MRNSLFAAPAAVVFKDKTPTLALHRQNLRFARCAYTHSSLRSTVPLVPLPASLSLSEHVVQLNRIPYDPGLDAFERALLCVCARLPLRGGRGWEG